MEPEQKSNGALIGSIVIIVILIIGGIFLWKNSLGGRAVPPNYDLSQENDSTTAYDSTAEIEANLNSMNFENLDEGI